MDLELEMRGESDLCDSAIDEEFNSRDITRLVGCEERDSCSDFVRIPEPSQRHVLCEFLFQFYKCIALLPGIKNRRINVARTECIHANVAPTQFVTPGAGK